MMRSVFLLFFCGLAAVLTAADAMPFQWQLERHRRAVHVTVCVEPGYYLYAKQIRLEGKCSGRPLNWLVPGPVMREGETVYPAGTWIWVAPAPEKGAVAVSVSFQGCSEAGECLLPETIRLSGPAADPGTGPAVDLPEFQVVRKLEGFAGVPEFLAFLQGGETAPAVPVSGLWICLLALAGGFMLNFTPCVLPLIPVNLAIIGAGSGAGWKTGLRRASCYGAGMAAACGTFGAAAVLTGARFGMLNSSAAFNAVIAVIFLVLALAMFGVFQLDLSRLNRRIRLPEPERRNMLTAFFLGAVSALLAGACVAPVLIAVLVYSGELYSGGNPAGLLLPFVLGIGMALPYPAAGAGFAVLPKPGRWMVHIKNTFGVLILIAAAYYAWTAWRLIPGRFRPEQEIRKLEAALATGRPVVADFRASWCGSCRKMEQTTLRDRQVLEALKQVEFVRFRAEKLSDPAVKQLLDRCGVRGLPAFVLIRKK